VIEHDVVHRVASTTRSRDRESMSTTRRRTTRRFTTRRRTTRRFTTHDDSTTTYDSTTSPLALDARRPPTTFAAIHSFVRDRHGRIDVEFDRARDDASELVVIIDDDAFAHAHAHAHARGDRGVDASTTNARERVDRRAVDVHHGDAV